MTFLLWARFGLLAAMATLVLALGWAHEFYVPHHLGRAAILLAGAAILTWLLVVVTAALVPWAAWVLAPYALWLTVATSLAVGYWRLAPASAVTVTGFAVIVSFAPTKVSV